MSNDVKFRIYTSLAFFVIALTLAAGQANQSNTATQAQKERSSAGAPTAETPTKDKSVKSLVQRRDSLQAQIRVLNDQVYYLSKLSRLIQQQRQTPKERRNELQPAINENEDYAGLAPGEAATANFATEIQNRNRELQVLTSALSTIDVQINQTDLGAC